MKRLYDEIAEFYAQNLNRSLFARRYGGKNVLSMAITTFLLYDIILAVSWLLEVPLFPTYQLHGLAKIFYLPIIVALPTAIYYFPKMNPLMLQAMHPVVLISATGQEIQISKKRNSWLGQIVESFRHSRDWINRYNNEFRPIKLKEFFSMLFNIEFAKTMLTIVKEKIEEKEKKIQALRKLYSNAFIVSILTLVLTLLSSHAFDFTVNAIKIKMICILTVMVCMLGVWCIDMLAQDKEEKMAYLYDMKQDLYDFILRKQRETEE